LNVSIGYYRIRISKEINVKNFKRYFLLALILLIISVTAFSLETPPIYQSTWGTAGNSAGQFLKPWGIAVDSSGNVYVADAYNYRIQKFDPNGVFIAWLGKGADESTGWHFPGTSVRAVWGLADGQFSAVYGVAIDIAGNIYVADTMNNRIQKFGPTGNFIVQWGTNGSAEGQFIYPSGIDVDLQGHVYVADSGNNRVQKFTSDGIFMVAWGSLGAGLENLNWPSDIALDDQGNIFVTDQNNNRINKYLSSGVLLQTWGVPGSAESQFNGPYGVAIDPKGDIYVTDKGNSRVQKFTSSGEFLTMWGTLGSSEGQFQFPLGVAVGSSGSIFIADTGNDRIQKFASAPVDQPPVTNAGPDQTITASSTAF